jgi:hypothetical protein
MGGIAGGAPFGPAALAGNSGTNALRWRGSD